VLLGAVLAEMRLDQKTATLNGIGKGCSGRTAVVLLQQL
jgi:hypothetical protein